MEKADEYRTVLSGRGFISRGERKRDHEMRERNEGVETYKSTCEGFISQTIGGREFAKRL